MERYIKNWLRCCNKFVSLNPKVKLIAIIGGAVLFLMVTMLLFEDLSLWKAFYFSIITGTTIGYGDISPQSVPGQISVIIFALITIFSLGDFVAMTVAASTDLLAKARKGLLRVKRPVDLTIIGYPNQSKVRSIVTEYRNDDVMHEASIVCITDRLDDKPDWMVDDGVVFIKGLASSREVLERANIYEMDKIIVLANDPENIASDDFTSSAVLMCEKLKPEVYTIAERVRKELDLFDMCNCDHVVEVSTGRELAHEAMNPGAIDLINSLFSTETPSTQRNFILTKTLSWYGAATSFLVKDATAIGYSLATTDQSEFNFSPKRDEELPVGTVIKYISDRTITEI